jgi:hypothetical protein
MVETFLVIPERREAADPESREQRECLDSEFAPSARPGMTNVEY